MRRPPRWQGFSLIELLISLLVLSFGMLGAIKMQLHSMQAAQQSAFYSTAMELASEIAEKIRSARSSSYLEIDFQSGQDRSEFSSNCFSTGCSAEQLAQVELVEWMQHVNAVLPHPRAVICRDSSPRLSWECASVGSEGSVVIKLGWADQWEADVEPPPRLALAVTPY